MQARSTGPTHEKNPPTHEKKPATQWVDEFAGIFGLVGGGVSAFFLPDAAFLSQLAHFFQWVARLFGRKNPLTQWVAGFFSWVSEFFSWVAGFP